MTYNKIIDDIKKLKIQGAHNVALKSLEALMYYVKNSKSRSPSNFLADIGNAKKKLFSARPTEPCMRNSLNYVLYGLDKSMALKELKATFLTNLKAAKLHLDESKDKMMRIGQRKIFSDAIIYTHCHSSTVVDILKYAKRKGKSFQVHNTETRPLFQGRITATELAKAGVPVKHYVDSGIYYALKEADIVLLGADAITSEGQVVNKIGTKLIAYLAEQFDIPIYFCCDSWKFDPLTIYGYEEKIEQRSADEIWSKPPSKVKVINPAFDSVDPDDVTGIISELGVFKPEVFVEEVKDNYPWIIQE